MNRASRYIFSSFIFRFFLCLTFFLFFYLLVDITLNFKQTIDTPASLNDIIFHYAKEIALKLDLLIPLCYLFSLLITLQTMTGTFETIAFQSLGIPPKNFLKPIRLFSWAMTAFLLFNHQFFIPGLSSYLPTLTQSPTSHWVKLSDDSLLVFNHYDPDEHAFFDTYWMKGSSLVFCEKLSFGAQSMEGTDCLFFHREHDGAFHCDATQAFAPLHDLPLVPTPTISSPSWELCSLTELLFNRWDPFNATPTTAYASLCSFWHYLALPFLTPLLFTLFSKQPLQYRRNKKIAFTIFIGLIAFLSFFTLFKALFVLCEFHVIPPYLAALIPYLIFSTIAMISSYRS